MWPLVGSLWEGMGGGVTLPLCGAHVLLAPSHGFSVEVEGPITFQEAAAGFGQSVVQFGSASAGGLIVGAPLQMGDVNETGKVYKCDPGSRRCQEIPIQRPPDAMNMSLGLSLAARGSEFLVCGPTVHRACGENMYVNGYCFLLDQSLQQRQRIPDTQPECPKHVTDIVLLVDSSGSIASVDFGKMKTFLSEIMKRFRKTDTQFALMQYSNKFEFHFDFMKYRRSHNPDHLLQGVEQLHGTTYTATAIRKVVLLRINNPPMPSPPPFSRRELFTSGRGARDEATKVLIVITDGQKYNDPLSYSDAIPEAERAGIIRYAIGVGQAFSSAAAQRELQEIASQPSNEHVFRVDSFDALQGIQNQLQEKIFAIEGTQSQSGSSFQLEMSQEGFSSLLSPDGPVLGAVGAYDWSGGIYLYGSSGKPSFINVSRTSTDMNDAYLGYSSQVITANGQSSYVVGAPRYQHAGKVVLFSRDTKGGEWTPRSEVLGEQIGSYFGGTLCAVDLDRDGNTDLLLIGSPMYYTPLNGGRVYICLINWLVRKRSGTLQGQTGQAFGRFGASMSEIGDISGDGRTDVAIGAPLENSNHGALYIFHGEKGATPSPLLIALSAPQRIEGSLFPSRLHYFGQAVSGGTDLTGDGLPDIAVGAQGQVLLLRSRPVLRVGVSISFQPPTIPTSAFNCQEQEQLNTEASRAEVCFTVTKSTMDSLGDRISSTIQYSLALDPGRTKIRAAFNSTGPVLSRELRLGIETRCETYRITLPLCPEDTLTPITLHVSYTLTGEPITATSRLRPILSEDSAPVSAGSLPFQKDCGTDDRCHDQLEISFNFSGLSTLVVGVTPELNTTVSIQNRGENSYSTTVQFFYPAALSYRRVLLLQGSMHRAGQGSGLWCSLPAQLPACITSHLSPLLPLPPSSDNGGPITERMIDRAELPVKYGIFIILTSGPRTGKSCILLSPLVPEHPVPHPAISFHPQDCSVATCKKIRCRITSLEMRQPLEFMIKGNVSFQWVSQVRELPLPSGYNGGGWVLGLLGPHLTAPLPQVQTVVERYEVYNYLPIIVGSSMGGLVLLALITAALCKVSGAGLGPLPHSPSPGGGACGSPRSWQRYKGFSFIGYHSPSLLLLYCDPASVWLSPSPLSVSFQLGFFQRQYKQMMEDAVEGEGPGPTQSAAAGNPPVADAPKQ
uniref:VWFA domain-containing protein n=1 Tax=Chrysemys picta bellii TaxID=8478 RepID=A0A8C3FS34_CHRPI